MPERPRQVLSLAQRTVHALLARGATEKISHLIVATTCPDMLSPSLGQMLHEQFHLQLLNTHTIDLVQGCAGGVTALILASQLAELNHSTVMVVQADAAKKATSKSKSIHRIFGNGSFACLISSGHAGKGLLHYKSRQYQSLSEVVTIKMGHDADEIIEKREKDLAKDPRKYLGLCIDSALAVRLLRNATFETEDGGDVEIRDGGVLGRRRRDEIAIERILAVTGIRIGRGRARSQFFSQLVAEDRNRLREVHRRKLGPGLDRRRQGPHRRARPRPRERRPPDRREAARRTDGGRGRYARPGRHRRWPAGRGRRRSRPAPRRPRPRGRSPG